MSVICFLPCRKGSERVPKKNIKPFANRPHGLIEIKINQLLESKEIDGIVLSTNDDEIIDFAKSLNNEKLVVHKRVENLSSSQTSTDQLVGHALQLIPDAHILWTHVTSPFITAEDYDRIIIKYYEALKEGYDSLMTTSLIHGFLWDKEKPINYDRQIEKWPRTQTLEPIHEINSAIFINHSSSYEKLNDRIGNTPLLYPLDKIKSFDIDWQDDFAIAECIVQSGLARI